jgi:hypothetical protein
MATHSKTRTAVERLRRAARRLRAREMQRARQASEGALRRGELNAPPCARTV